VLAMIEQGLQVFNAIAKRFFRSAREEYELLFEKIGRYGGTGWRRITAPSSTIRQPISAPTSPMQDLDIRPISDPSAVTQMQKMAKAQFLESKMGAIASVGGDLRAVITRVLEAADIEDIEKLLPPPQPQPPDPMQIAELQKLSAAAGKDAALSEKANADAVLTAVRGQAEKYDLEHRAISDGMAARHLG
jgi:hypothetical protein